MLASATAAALAAAATLAAAAALTTAVQRGYVAHLKPPGCMGRQVKPCHACLELRLGLR